MSHSPSCHLAETGLAFDFTLGHRGEGWFYRNSGDDDDLNLK